MIVMSMFFWRKKKARPYGYPDETAPITVRIFVEEREDKPAVWDITLEITNNTEQARRWGCVLKVDGEILETPLGVRVIDKNRIAISDIVLQPRQKVKLGGIVMMSPHAPRVSIEPTPQVMLASEEGRLRISVEKMVKPSEGGLLEVEIRIRNETQTTVSHLPFRDRVPNTFEVDRTSINPQPDSVDELSDGSILIAWTLDLGPNEERTLTYRVRAKTRGAKISELYRIYPG